MENAVPTQEIDQTLSPQHRNARLDLSSAQHVHSQRHATKALCCCKNCIPRWHDDNGKRHGGQHLDTNNRHAFCVMAKRIICFCFVTEPAMRVVLALLAMALCASAAPLTSHFLQEHIDASIVKGEWKFAQELPESAAVTVNRTLYAHNL